MSLRPFSIVVLVAVAAVRCSAQEDSVAVVEEAERDRPDVLLITLDTTRSDFVGAWGAEGVETPHLDRLADAGVRWERAVAPAPVTLPSHASLLTGLAPPEHGLRDNGYGRLPDDVETLAEVFRNAGYQTAAFVASRVLDRRFGLDRGFDHYGDEMVAERVGEYGYAERDAPAVTDAALEWMRSRAASAPSFAWVHYYDPHSPYTPPGRSAGASSEDLYAGEIEFVDREIGRLLDAARGETLVAVVADHGESLGEHGERAHGILLTRPVLEVPMLVAGPGVRSGVVVEEPVAALRLGGSLLRLSGLEGQGWPALLPGLEPDGDRTRSGAEPIFSETLLPATAYGWSPLASITEGRWRYVEAPRPELYDVVADPAESTNLVSEKPEIAARLAGRLTEMRASFDAREADAVAPDADLRAALESLGYLSGSTASLDGEIDPKDGVRWLDEFQAAKNKLGAGDVRGALRDLESLVRRNPNNVPFLNNLAHAQRAAGQGEKAVETYRRAAALNPKQEFVHVNLGDALLGVGRLDEAEAEFRLALELDPKQLTAWQRLSDIELAKQDPAAARRVLEEAVAAGTRSAVLWTQLAVLQNATGAPAEARASVQRAHGISPEFAPAWILDGQLSLAAGDSSGAIVAFERAVAADPNHPGALLSLGRELFRVGDPRARGYLERVLQLDPGSREASLARRLLSGRG